MVLVNKKMLAGGMAMVAVGLILTININAAVPVGQAGMTDEEKLDLMLAEHEKVVAEGAGATGLAALLQNTSMFKGKKVGVVICGGNIDSKVLSSILMRDLVRSGQVTTLSITLPDKPGQLAIISKICAANGANVLQVEHSRFTIDLSASLAKLNITVETQNSDHLNKIVKEIERNGLPVEIEGLV